MAQKKNKYAVYKMDGAAHGWQWVVDREFATLREARAYARKQERAAEPHNRDPEHKMIAFAAGRRI